jgi:hypothetical protein
MRECYKSKKIKWRDLWDDKEQAGSARYWKTLRREERAGKKSRRLHYGKKEKNGDFLCINWL